MLQVASILFAAAFTFLTCLCLGKSLLKLTRAKLYRSEELFFGFLLGAACLSTIVLLVGLAGWAYSWVFFAIGCGSFALAWWSGAHRFTSERLPPVPLPWTILFWSGYAVFGSLYFMNALAPEVSSDGALFHVALPALYLREHRIPPITTNFLATMSEGLEMLFLFAFAFGKHSATAIVHLLFTFLLPVGMVSYARRIGAPVAGVVGGLLFFLSPAVGVYGCIAYLDVGVAAVTFAVFYMVQIWLADRDKGLLLPLGLIAGFGYAIKYTAFLVVPYAVALLAFRLFRMSKSIWRPCMTVSFAALAIMSPWMIKNAIFVGNPVSPFANRVFRNPYLYVTTEEIYRNNMGSLEGMPLWRLPYEVTVRGNRTQGFVGPIFLLAPLALLALTVPAGRQVLFAATLFALPFRSYPVVRILLPALPLICFAMGIVASRWKQGALALLVMHATLSWPGEIPKYANRAAIRMLFPDWKAALRLTPEPEFLNSHLDDYGLDVLLDAKTAPRDRIFAFSGFANAYHSRQVIVEWQSALGIRLGEILKAPVSPWLQPVQHVEFHFEPRTVRKVRLVQTAGTGAEQWSVSELRVFRNGSEMPRVPEWRLRAFPNPWDVQLAFDNSPLTRWGSREHPKPGMFIEVDFGKLETIDRVTADCTPDQGEPRLVLDGIPAKIDVTNTIMPERLRRAAVDELKRHGVQWLAIHDLDPGARDFRFRAAQWGIQLAGIAGRWRLYHLE